MRIKANCKMMQAQHWVTFLQLVLLGDEKPLVLGVLGKYLADSVTVTGDYISGKCTFEV